MEKIFDIIAPVYENFHFNAQKTFNNIESIISFQPSDKILDLGGGTGTIAKFFMNKVQNITVVDSSDKMVKQCRLLHPKVSCIYADAQNLPIADGIINKIIIVDAFHHFQNQEQVVKEVKRVLAKNGKVIIEEFNPTKITGRLVAIMENIFLRMGSIFHSPESLADLFSSNFFKVQVFDTGKRVYYIIAEKI